MRLAAQAKCGFYPAHDGAIAGICQHIAMPATGTDGINILDPCAGEGAAIHQIATTLGIPESQVYCVELEQNRGKLTQERMPGAHVLYPASFHGVKITGYAFSLAYVNPPFDNELGGGRREEESFVRRATHLLDTGGVLVLVAPLTAVNGNTGFCDYLDAHYEDIQLLQFPKEVQHYKEIVVIGRKRKMELPAQSIHNHGTLNKAEFNWRTYGGIWEREIPVVGTSEYKTFITGKVYEKKPAEPFPLKKTWKPHTFVKAQYLEEELAEDLASSPLNRVVLGEVRPVELSRPPLPPGGGHVSLLVASGMLDGVVDDGQGGVHVVRGTARKEEYRNLAACKSTEDPKTGAVTTKEVWSQRVVLVIRTAWPDGQILSWSDAPAKPTDVDAEPEEGSNKDLGEYELPTQAQKAADAARLSALQYA